jgi:hypothetical protein
MFNLANTSMPTFQIDKTETQCVVTWRHYHTAVFVWFIVLAGLAIGGAFLAGLPLWGLAFFLIALIIHTLFGKTKIVINADGFHSMYTNPMKRRDKRIELAEIRRFEKQMRSSTGKLSSSQYTYLLRVVSQNERSSKSFGFPSTDTLEEEIDELCAQLNIFLGTLKAEVAGVPAKWEMPDPIEFRLNSPPQHLESPPKNRWYYQTDFEGICFQKRGEDTMGDSIALPIAVFFISCIILTFAFLDGEWAVVLIPLLLVGMYFLATPLQYLFKLFHRTKWTFAREEAEFRGIRLFRTRVENYDLTDWHSLIVRLPEDEEVKPELIAEGNHDAIRDYYDACHLWQLAFLNAAGERIIAIEKLSKPEALWMADVLLREQRAVR